MVSSAVNTIASIPGDEDAKSDTSSDMDCSSDSDVDADEEADANATIAPNARVNDKPNPDSNSDLDLACAPDSDVQNGRDTSAKAAESDSDLTSMELSFPLPVWELQKKSSTATSTQKSSTVADNQSHPVGPERF